MTTPLQINESSPQYRQSYASYQAIKISDTAMENEAGPSRVATSVGTQTQILNKETSTDGDWVPEGVPYQGRVMKRQNIWTKLLELTKRQKLRLAKLRRGPKLITRMNQTARVEKVSVECQTDWTLIEIEIEERKEKRERVIDEWGKIIEVDGTEEWEEEKTESERKTEKEKIEEPGYERRLKEIEIEELKEKRERVIDEWGEIIEVDSTEEWEEEKTEGERKTEERKGEEKDEKMENERGSKKKIEETDTRNETETPTPDKNEETSEGGTAKSWKEWKQKEKEKKKKALMLRLFGEEDIELTDEEIEEERGEISEEMIQWCKETAATQEEEEAKLIALMAEDKKKNENEKEITDEEMKKEETKKEEQDRKKMPKPKEKPKTTKKIRNKDNGETINKDPNLDIIEIDENDIKDWMPGEGKPSKKRRKERQGKESIVKKMRTVALQDTTNTTLAHMPSLS